MEKYVKLGDLGGKSSDEGVGRGSSASRGRSPSVGSKRMKCVSDVESECESVSADEMNEMRGISAKLRKYVFTESNRVSKVTSEFLLGCVSEYEEQMMRLVRKNERLQGRLDECKERERQNECERMSRVASYASVAGMTGVGGVSGERRDGVSVRGKSKEKSFAVVVKARDANVKMTSEQVKEKIMKDVSGQLNVCVKALRRTRAGGVAIEAATARDMKLLQECKRFEDVGLKVELPKKVGPKVLIFDIPCEITNDELLNEMYVKNVKNGKCSVSESEFKERSRVVNRTNKKDANVGNAIVEVSKGVRDVLMDEGRMYVKWRACKVKEYVSVLRCHKCYAFGHMMRECSMKDRLCQQCGESGHVRSECKKERMCRNCKMKGLKCDHSVMWDECPEYVRMAEREKLRISDD
ncbi:Uncharacterized 50 kDa protein in type I retrotransposable element R1DM [Anthophora quadrimaculata]